MGLIECYDSRDRTFYMWADISHKVYEGFGQYHTVIEFEVDGIAVVGRELNIAHPSLRFLNA